MKRCSLYKFPLVLYDTQDYEIVMVYSILVHNFDHFTIAHRTKKFFCRSSTKIKRYFAINYFFFILIIMSRVLGAAMTPKITQCSALGLQMTGALIVTVSAIVGIYCTYIYWLHNENLPMPIMHHRIKVLSKDNPTHKFLLICSYIKCKCML